MPHRARETVSLRSLDEAEAKSGAVVPRRKTWISLSPHPGYELETIPRHARATAERETAVLTNSSCQTSQIAMAVPSQASTCPSGQIYAAAAASVLASQMRTVATARNSRAAIAQTLRVAADRKKHRRLPRRQELPVPELPPTPKSSSAHWYRTRYAAAISDPNESGSRANWRAPVPSAGISADMRRLQTAAPAKLRQHTKNTAAVACVIPRNGPRQRKGAL
jgi:hypothetical protein